MISLHQPHTLLPWKLQSCHELNITNALLMFHSGYHGNHVSIVTTYEVMPIVPKNLHTKCGLNMACDKGVINDHCGCHGNLVTIATRYAADAYVPNEPPYQI